MAKIFKTLSTVTVGSGGAASIEFTNIPATYTDLLIKFSGRNSRSAEVLQEFAMAFNNNNSANYTTIQLRGSGSAVLAATTTNDTFFGQLGQPGAGATSNTFSNYDIYIPNYASSNNKSISIDAVTENNAAAAYAYFQAGLLTNGSAITSIQISAPSYLIVEYSTFYLYGIFNGS
jgi:hypothetical protein